MAFELNKGTGDPRASFPVRLARWLVRRAELVGVLFELRRTGHTPDAVDVLLALPDVEEIRAAWEDWLTALDDADRAASFLLAMVPIDVLAAAMFALWGTPVGTGHWCRRTRKKVWSLSDCRH
jgi:hypothetical protein